MINPIYNWTFVFLFYSIFTFSLPNSNLLKKSHSFKDQSSKQYEKTYILQESSLKIQKALMKKMSLDLQYRKVVSKNFKSEVAIQVSVTTEGHIIGYKSVQLRLVSYSLEEQLIKLLKRNTSVANLGTSIYWLKITNKY